MEIETFNNTYNADMMKLISDFHNQEVSRLQSLLSNESHYVLNKAIGNGEFERLSKMKMLIACYPACPICFIPGCGSDHS